MSAVSRLLGLYDMNIPEPVNSVDEEDDLGVEDDMVQGSSKGMLSSGFTAAFGQIVRDE